MCSPMEIFLQLEAVKPPLQMQPILDAFRQILIFKGVTNLLCRSFCHHMILDVLYQTRPIDVTCHPIRLVPILI